MLFMSITPPLESVQVAVILDKYCRLSRMSHAQLHESQTMGSFCKLKFK